MEVVFVLSALNLLKKCEGREMLDITRGVCHISVTRLGTKQRWAKEHFSLARGEVVYGVRADWSFI